MKSDVERAEDVLRELKEWFGWDDEKSASQRGMRVGGPSRNCRDLPNSLKGNSQKSREERAAREQQHDKAQETETFFSVRH
jgi:hypothetical protein